MGNPEAQERQRERSVRARPISILEIAFACEGAPAASVERGSCGELMELSSGLMLEVSTATGIANDARRGAEVRREACCGGLWRCGRRLGVAQALRRVLGVGQNILIYLLFGPISWEWIAVGISGIFGRILAPQRKKETSVTRGGAGGGRGPIINHKIIRLVSSGSGESRSRGGSDKLSSLSESRGRHIAISISSGNLKLMCATLPSRGAPSVSSTHAEWSRGYIASPIRAANPTASWRMRNAHTTSCHLSVPLCEGRSHSNLAL